MILKRMFKKEKEEEPEKKVYSVTIFLSNGTNRVFVYEQENIRNELINRIENSIRNGKILEINHMIHDVRVRIYKPHQDIIGIEF